MPQRTDSNRLRWFLTALATPAAVFMSGAALADDVPLPDAAPDAYDQLIDQKAPTAWPQVGWVTTGVPKQGMPAIEATPIRRRMRVAMLAGGITASAIGTGMLLTGAVWYPTPQGEFLDFHRFAAAILMATGGVHLLVGIPLTIAGAVGEDVRAGSQRPRRPVTIEPVVGLGQLGLRGSF